MYNFTYVHATNLRAKNRDIYHPSRREEAREDDAWVEDASDLRRRARRNRSDRASLFWVAVSVARARTGIPQNLLNRLVGVDPSRPPTEEPTTNEETAN